jgi:hypothetical protein
MSKHVTFVERALAGDVLDLAGEIDDDIDAWNESDSELQLHEWLGLTQDEYNLFATQPSLLRLILMSRRWDDGTLLELARDPNDVKLAARGATPAELETAHQWLRQTGRI